VDKEFCTICHLVGEPIIVAVGQEFDGRIVEYNGKICPECRHQYDHVVYDNLSRESKGTLAEQ
jgi:hypothetical protein